MRRRPAPQQPRQPSPQSSAAPTPQSQPTEPELPTQAPAPDPGPSVAPPAAESPSWEQEIDPRSGEPWLYPNLHGIIYGEFASGKSSFLATMIEYLFKHWGLPSIVFGFDPPGKMWPYRELGEWEGPPDDEATVAYYAERGIEVTDVCTDEGELIVRIEHYAEVENPLLPSALTTVPSPQAWNRFNSRVAGFSAEAEGWGAALLDSMTGLIYANMSLQKALKPMAAFEKGQDTRQWWAMATDDVEALITSRLPWWRTNVFMACHIAEDKEEFAEGMLRGIGLVGRLKKNAGRLYEEVYRMVVVPDPGRPGQYTRRLQTQSDSLWPATSLIAKAANPCAPTYHALWGNYRRRKLGIVDEEAHAPVPTARGRRRR